MRHDAIDSESFEVDGYQVQAEVLADVDAESPWDSCDGHGKVSEWTRREKHPGEWVLCEDRGSKRYYDAQGAQIEALRDGWDTKPYKTGTKGEQAARAVKADFEYLRAWCNDEWSYVGVRVSVSRNGIEVAADSLWGIESLDNYPMEQAREMASYIVETDKKARKAESARKAKETRERKFWAMRDCATI